MATFKTYQDKDGNLKWGVLLDSSEAGRAQHGAKWSVTKRNGKTKEVTLDQPITNELWSIVGAGKARRRGYVPKRDGNCKDCGAAIPSKYERCLSCVKGDAPSPEPRKPEPVENASPYPAW